MLKDQLKKVDDASIQYLKNFNTHISSLIPDPHISLSAEYMDKMIQDGIAINKQYDALYNRRPTIQESAACHFNQAMHLESLCAISYYCYEYKSNKYTLTAATDIDLIKARTYFDYTLSYSEQRLKHIKLALEAYTSKNDIKVTQKFKVTYEEYNIILKDELKFLNMQQDVAPEGMQDPMVAQDEENQDSADSESVSSDLHSVSESESSDLHSDTDTAFDTASDADTTGQASLQDSLIHNAPNPLAENIVQAPDSTNEIEPSPNSITRSPATSLKRAIETQIEALFIFTTNGISDNLSKKARLLEIKTAFDDQFNSQMKLLNGSKSRSNPAGFFYKNSPATSSSSSYTSVQSSDNTTKAVSI